MNRNLKNIEVAESIISKSIGLIGRKEWGKSKGMLIPDSNAIHTFFVKFTIDIVFLSREFEVVKIKENLKPFRFSPIAWGAKHTLELPKGSVKNNNIQIGDKIIIEK